jgi:hypothetical protein
MSFWKKIEEALRMPFAMSFHVELPSVWNEC